MLVPLTDTQSGDIKAEMALSGQEWSFLFSGTVGRYRLWKDSPARFHRATGAVDVREQLVT